MFNKFFDVLWLINATQLLRAGRRVKLIKGCAYNQFERGIMEMFGAYHKSVDPGLHFIIPFAQNILRVNMREQVIDVLPPFFHAISE
jgi:regulator of protease activity HflC (stomatin/prohibitin superfamily)